MLDKILIAHKYYLSSHSASPPSRNLTGWEDKKATKPKGMCWKMQIQKCMGEAPRMEWVKVAEKYHNLTMAVASKMTLKEMENKWFS